MSVKTIDDCLDDETPLWRYMNLDKYTSFVQRRAVYHARADRFLDPFEGFLPSMRIKTERPSRDALEWASRIGAEPDVVDYTGDPLVLAHIVRLQNYVSCWHKSKAGVSVVTTIGKLARAVKQYQDRLKQQSGSPFTSFRAALSNVVYHDADSETEISVDLETLLFCKRNAYNHEREVRLVVTHDLPLRNIGWWLPVDISACLDRVVVSPGAGQDLINRIAALTRSSGKSIHRFSLDDAPDWDRVTQ
jgi:hypothetical protein